MTAAAEERSGWPLVFALSIIGRPCGILDLEEEERVTLGHIAGEGQSHVVDVTRRCRKICTVIAHRDRCGNLLSKSQVLGHDKLVPSLRFF